MDTKKLAKNKGQSKAIFPPPELDTLPKLLKWQSERLGDKVFIRRKDRGLYQRWTWKQAYDEVKYFCLGLMSLGLNREETVALIGENEPELFWGHWATQSAGAKAVCIYPDATPQEVHYALDHSDALFAVCEDQEQVDKVLEIKDKLPKIKKIIYWDPRGMWKYSDPILMTFGEVQAEGRSYEQSHPGAFEENISKGKGSDIGVLSYTSGTTGAHPKGVIMTHAGLIDSAYRVMASLPLYPFMQYLSYIAPAWGTEQAFGLTMGLALPYVINFPEEPETIQENIREVGAELLVFSPRQWESLASTVQARMLDASPFAQFCYRQAMGIGEKVAIGRLEEEPVNPLWQLLYPLAYVAVLRPLLDKLGLLKVRVAICGGSAMAPDVFRFFHSMGLKLRNLFGITEVGLLTTHMGNHFDVATVGRFMPVHPALGQPMEWRVDGVTGELMLRGGVGFQGYYKNPEATAEAQRDGWYLSGDAVAVREDGELVYLERVRDMRSLSTGARFPPQFIETRLRFSPFIKDAMCLGDETKPFVAALINIDSETVGRWAEQRGIAYATFPDLSQKAEVRELIRQEILKVNRDLGDEAKVKRFANLPKELDPDEAELTRTRKLRRSFLEERYSGLIEAIYQQKAEYVTEVPVKYRDGRVGKVTTATKIMDIETPVEVTK